MSDLNSAYPDTDSYMSARLTSQVTFEDNEIQHVRLNSENKNRHYQNDISDSDNDDVSYCHSDNVDFGFPYLMNVLDFIIVECIAV